MDQLASFFSSEWLTKPVWVWLLFLTLVGALLAFDLGVLHRKRREIGVAESLKLSGLYVGLGLAFGGWVWWAFGAQSGMDYLTGFLVEKALALDNVFVIALIFTFFAVPRAYQHRVLFWGILGVIVLRAIMIGLGTTIVQNFEWVLYLFAAFLIFTGVKMALAGDKPHDLATNPVLCWLKRHVPVTDRLHGERFFVPQPHGEQGRMRLVATPLFLALVMVELADLVFAVDSIPAILAITTDPFIVYTSNIFAILGLRALYFALAAMVERFRYLKLALSAVLVFIGGKIVVAGLLGIDKVPAAISLGVTATLIASGIAYSLWRTRRAAGPAALSNQR